MASCQCGGETCNCAAIQVPPKLGFLKKHDRPVNSFVAWVAVLNMALIAALPITMYAQELGGLPPEPQPTFDGIVIDRLP